MKSAADAVIPHQGVQSHSWLKILGRVKTNHKLKFWTVLQLLLIDFNAYVMLKMQRQSLTRKWQLEFAIPDFIDTTTCIPMSRFTLPLELIVLANIISTHELFKSWSIHHPINILRLDSYSARSKPFVKMSAFWILVSIFLTSILPCWKHWIESRLEERLTWLGLVLARPRSLLTWLDNAEVATTKERWARLEVEKVDAINKTVDH